MRGNLPDGRALNGPGGTKIGVGLEFPCLNVAEEIGAEGVGVE